MRSGGELAPSAAVALVVGARGGIRWRAPTFTGFRTAGVLPGPVGQQPVGRCGSASFIVGIRALHRQLSNLVGRARFVQWMQKSLDQMNVQIHCGHRSDQTGMAMVRAIALRPVNWREEHLFNLKALEFYDMSARSMRASWNASGGAPSAQANAIKEKAIRRRGGHNVRTGGRRPDAHPSAPKPP